MKSTPFKKNEDSKEPISNDAMPNSIRRCKRCGKELSTDTNGKYCDDCIAARKEKHKKIRKWVLGGAIATIFFCLIYWASSSSESEDESSVDVNDEDNGDNEKGNMGEIDFMSVDEQKVCDSSIPECPLCHTNEYMKGDPPDESRFFNCSYCGGRFFLEDNGDVVDVFHRHHGSSRTCRYCGNSLAGGEYVAAWEEGNADAYTKCPHCNRANFEYDD